MVILLMIKECFCLEFTDLQLVLFFSLNALNCNPGHSRGFCGTGSSSARPGTGSHKQYGPSVHPHNSHSSRNSADAESVRIKNTSTSSRTSTQCTSKSNPLAIDSSAVGQGHATGRKSKGAKQNQHNSQHHGHSPMEQHSPLPPPPPVPQHQEPQPERLSPTPLIHPSHPERASSTRHSSEDSDITSLIEAMDKDFDHHDSPPLEVFTEQPPSPLSKSKGKHPFLQKSTNG